MQKYFKSVLATALALLAVSCGKTETPVVPEVAWDAQSLIIDGKRVMPVMGEVHYSRIPADEWEAEVRKMKDGGVTMIAAYVFWNHHEETEGKFDWSGERDLRRFVEICKANDLPVVLRMGPFCHGEARNGGIPDFMFEKGCRMRSEDSVFLASVERLYAGIYEQVKDLQWKDGGPIIAAQFDNEYRGHGSYLMSLKKIATDLGFDLPFYTRTGWPELATPVPYGEMLPLYGDYADGFWERSTASGVGNYYKAFNFKEFRSSDAIATEQLDSAALAVKTDNAYPYFTCELGGGMTKAYHRRPYMYPEDAYALAMVKLGSGSNLLGYYMYHGGTNPESRTGVYLNEDQDTPGTNYNDMMHKSYEFQAPLGESGQVNPHFFTLRKLHMFMADYGDVLAPMPATFPAKQDLAQGEDSTLRWAYRSAGDSGFVFVCNYERLRRLSDKKGVQFDVCGTIFPSQPIDIPSGAVFHFPVGIGGMDYATAQIVARRDGKIYLEQIPGIPTEISVGGKLYKDLKPKGVDTPVVGNIYLLDSPTAEHLFLPEGYGERSVAETLPYTRVAEAGAPRAVPMGAKGVAKQPDDVDFDAAAVYEIPLPADRTDALLRIEYVGDCARVYAGGRYIADDFYNGCPLELALWRVPADVDRIQLKVLPLSPGMPVYFSEEADLSAPGERVKAVSVLR